MKSKSLPKIMYDQTQYTSVWMMDKNGVWLNDESYFGMQKISGYAPDRWITYTQNKPKSFFFGAYDQKALDKESAFGFKNFNDDDFVKEFEDAISESYNRTKVLSNKYFDTFYKREKEAVDNNSSDVVEFLKQIRKDSTYIMSYYFLTQPQRFTRFGEEIKKHLPDKKLELISTTGRHLTYISKLTSTITSFAQKLLNEKLSYNLYIKKYPKEYEGVKKIINELGFLNWGLLGGDLIDESYFEKEVDLFISNKSKLNNEIKKINELNSQIVERNEYLVTNISDATRIADIMGHSSVMRFDLQTCMLCIVNYANNFVKIAQEKYSLPDAEIASYSFDEILELIEYGKLQDPKVLIERQKGFLTIWSQNKIKNYVADKAHAQIKDLLEFRINEINTTKEVHGTIASLPNNKQLIISGRAFVLTSAFESGESLKDFQENDILIATQTHPNLVPIMKKASAIVTDEGGITCHAAIVSRELKKPCIIGTKLATKCFKTGAFVELDMQDGSVKLIDNS